MTDDNPAGNLSMAQVMRYLQSREYVDLTHTFAPGIPHWPGFPDERREVLFSYEQGVGGNGSGALAHRYSLVGQWGTHVDPPAHFIPGSRTVDQIDLKEMVLPLVVLDIHHQVEKNPDYTVRLSDVVAWENRHGTIPSGSFVALRTDWSRRWPDDRAMQNKDAQGTAHYPGWSREVLQCLFEDRKITACGHETTDTSCGLDCTKGDYSLEAYILSADHYQVELLANLDNLPESGAMVIVAFPKPKAGSGFPARVFAILP